jgi:hypothetical protein
MRTHDVLQRPEGFLFSLLLYLGPILGNFCYGCLDALGKTPRL